MKSPFVLGRLIFGGFFVYNGIHHLIARKDMVPYAAAKKVPAPEIAISGTGVLLLIGGLSLATGVKPKLGAAAIVGFLAAVSPVMHAFWNDNDAGQRMMDTIQFSKNMALLGAALALSEMEAASVPELRENEKGVWKAA